MSHRSELYHLPLEVIYLWRMWLIVGPLPLDGVLEVICYRSLSTIAGCLSLEVIFQWRSCYNRNSLPLEVVFNWWQKKIMSEIFWGGNFCSFNDYLFCQNKFFVGYNIFWSGKKKVFGKSFDGKIFLLGKTLIGKKCCRKILLLGKQIWSENFFVPKTF